MIKELDLFRVKVFQPAPLVPGNIKDNGVRLEKFIRSVNSECDLIIASYGSISGCSKHHSLSSIRSLQDEVNHRIKLLNKYAKVPVIINDITGLYYLDTHNSYVRIKTGKVRFQDRVTIRFIDNDNLVMSTPIQELREDLVVLYDTPSPVLLQSITEINKNNALWISRDYDDSVEVKDQSLLFFSRGIIGSETTTFDIEPSKHDPSEFSIEDEYTVIYWSSDWDVEKKEDLYYYSPEFDHLVAYSSGYCERVFNKQVKGLENKLKILGKGIKSFIGVSGGSDSTLALLATHSAYINLGWNIKNIIGVSMPCFGTTDRTKNNAKKLIDSLGITYMEVDIKDPVLSHLTSINHAPNSFNSAYENAQARMRMMTLFGLSNDQGGIVIGTGDLSEAWLGWCTYGGDDLASYNPNCRILKTTVLQILRYLSDAARLRYLNDVREDISSILYDIIETPISPELIQGGQEKQKSEDILGPYILHDIFITGICLGWTERKMKGLAKLYTGIDETTINLTYDKNLKRFSGSQFKRAINVPGPNIGLDNDILSNINMPTDFRL